MAPSFAGARSWSSGSSRKVCGWTVRTILTLVVTLGLPVTALVWAQDADRRSTWFWSNADLKKMTVAEVLPKAKSTPIGIAAKPLLSTPTHAIVLAGREKGFPELHE